MQQEERGAVCLQKRLINLHRQHLLSKQSQKFQGFMRQITGLDLNAKPSDCYLDGGITAKQVFSFWAHELR